MTEESNERVIDLSSSFGRRQEFDRRINQFGYRYVAPLGKGASGFVIRARPVSKDEEDDSEDVAIKFIPLENIVKSKVLRKKLEREISIHRLLEHENLINFIDAYKDKEFVYIVIEFAKDGDLCNRLIKTSTKLKEEEVFDYFQQIVNGLEYLHDKCISHRDLKLENVLISGNTLKICDFGLSILLGKNKLAESCVGSLEYISPEILVSQGKQKYDGFKADIFSLGVILYCLTMNEFPFPGSQREPGSEVLKFRTPIDESLEDLIRGMMWCIPKQRLSLSGIRSHMWWKKMEKKTGIKSSKKRKKRKKKRQKLDVFQPKMKAKSMPSVLGQEKVETVLKPKTRNLTKSPDEKKEEREGEGDETDEETDTDDEEEKEKEKRKGITKHELASGIGTKILSFFKEVGLFINEQLSAGSQHVEEKLEAEGVNLEKIYYKIVKNRVEKGEMLTPVTLKFDDGDDDDDVFEKSLKKKDDV